MKRYIALAGPIVAILVFLATRWSAHAADYTAHKAQQAATEATLTEQVRDIRERTIRIENLLLQNRKQTCGGEP